jgi:hypothetical protein
MPTAWLIAGDEAPTPRMATACGWLLKPFGTDTPAITPTRSCKSITPFASISRRDTTPIDTGVVRASELTRSALTTTSGKGSLAVADCGAWPGTASCARTGWCASPATSSAAAAAIKGWWRRAGVSGGMWSHPVGAGRAGLLLDQV